MTGSAAILHDEWMGLGQTDCPYRGLRPYTERDADFFFGREADRDLVIANIMASRLTVLCGPSGVGKSSLLRAGVLGELRHEGGSSFGFLAAENVVAVYFASWRDDPLMGLSRALHDALPAGADRDDLFRVPVPFSPALVQEVVSRFDADLYLLLDQLEELELYQHGAAGDRFAAELGAIINDHGLRVNVLLGVREDALAKLDRFEQQVPGFLDNYLRLDYLTPAAARQAIENPVERYNGARPPQQHIYIEHELVDRLLVELQTGRVAVTDTGRGIVRDAPGTIETPFLQLVMTRLWIEEVERRRSHAIRLSTLDQLGGAEHIVRSHLDDVMSHLTAGQRDLAAVIFGHLVTPSGTKIAHTVLDLAEYAELTDLTELSSLLERLSSGRQRILRPVAPPIDHPGPPRFEIFHDVMAPAVLDWRRRHIAMRQRQEAERSLIDAARVEEEGHRETRRRLRRSRLFSAALVLLLVVCVGLVALFLDQKQAAQHQTQAAEEARQQAEQSKDLMEFEQSRDRDPATSLQNAYTAWTSRPTAEAESVVRLALDADHNRHTLPVGGGPLSSGSYSPDGRLLLTSAGDGVARTFDAQTGIGGESYRPASGTPAPLWDAAFSPDGSMIATSASTGEVMVYDTATTAVLADIVDYKNEYGAHATWTTRDGSPVLLITSGNGDPPGLWDPRTGTSIVTFDSPARRTYQAAMSNDGTRMVSSGTTNGTTTITLWDSRTGAEIKTAPFELYEIDRPVFVMDGSDRVAFAAKESSFLGWELMFWDTTGDSTEPTTTTTWSNYTPVLDVSADGKRIAFGGDKRVLVFNATTAELDALIPVQAAVITDVVFSPDGQWLATADNDGGVFLWRADRFVTVGPTTRLLGHVGPVASVGFNPGDPAKLVTAGMDGTLRTWELPYRKVLSTHDINWIQDADVAGDARRILAADDFGHWTAFDAAGAKVAEDLLPDSGVLQHVSLSANGSIAAAVMDPGFAPRVWRLDGGGALPDFTPAGTTLRGVAISGDGALVAAGDTSNRIMIWSATTGDIVDTFAAEPTYWINDVAFVPGSDLIAGASDDGTVRFWRPGTGVPERTFGEPGSAGVSSLDFSDDGAFMATIAYDNVVRSYDLRTGATVEMKSTGVSLHDVDHSPDGALLAAGASDGAVYVWDRQTGNLLGALTRHGEMVNSVDFLDNQQLLTASDDGTAAIIPCEVACAPVNDVMDAAADRIKNRNPN